MKYRTSMLVVGLSVACWGCATTSQTSVEEIATARASITMAEQTGAQQHGLADLTKARQKLTRADNLANDGEHEAAARLAAESEVDARLAAAKAALRKSEESAKELDATLDTLEDELDRIQHKE